MLQKVILYTKLLILCCAILYGNMSDVYGKTKVDSIKNLLNSTESDSLKVELYLDIVNLIEVGNVDSAVIFADYALNIANEINDNYLIARANIQMGSIFFNQGNFNRAISYYFKALEYYEQEKNYYNLIISNFNIALVYKSLNDNVRSQEYYFKSLDNYNLYRQKDSLVVQKFPIGRIYNNIGVTYQDAGESDVALEYFYKALQISDETDNEVAKPFAYNNIGLIYHDKKDYEIALSFFLKALAIREKIDDKKGIALIYSYMADSYRLKNEHDSADKYYDKAFELAKEQKYFELQKNIAEVLVEYYAKLGFFEKSYSIHVAYKELSEQLDLIEGSKAAAMLDMQYKFDKFQKGIELNQQRTNFINLLFYGVLISLLIVFTLMFFLTQSKVRRIRLQRQTLLLEKQNLESKLEYRNKELTTNVMYLVRKNELISNISERLLTLKSDLSKVNQKPIQEIILELRRSVDDDVWEEFEYRFKEVHEDFYNTLNERYPDLSPNEKKLCAFLRLNMSTKEISAITFQSTHSITIARSRLRKKLDINNTDVNLVDFLISL